MLQFPRLASLSSDSTIDFEPRADGGWSAVGAGQVLPPGLHVRMDVTTGLAEARLMPEEEE